MNSTTKPAAAAAATPIGVQPSLVAARAAQLLRSHAYLFGNEIDLHATLDATLRAAGMEFQREFSWDKRNRFDFWMPIGDSGVVIEVKVDESQSPALRQVSRYLALPCQPHVVLATTCSWGRRAIVVPLFEKRFTLVQLQRQGL